MAKDFEELVSGRRKVTVRQAHNLIKKAVANREILRVQLTSGTVLYGLAEFGPSKSKVSKGKDLARSGFYRVLEQQFWKEREKVMHLRSLSSMLDIFNAWELTRRFAEVLPKSDQKRQLMESIEEIHEEAMTHGLTGFLPGPLARTN